MKKFLFTSVLLFSAMIIFAQNTKDLIKSGDFVKATMYYENGVKSQEGFYNKEGKLQGTWTSYNEQGNKTAVAQYNNGEKVGTWYFYEGEVLREVIYTNNKIAKVTTWKDSESQIVSNFE